MLDKLFGNGSWSSKKISGYLLVISGIVLTFLVVLGDKATTETIIGAGSLITAGLGCFGIDAINKKTRSNSNKFDGA